MSTEAVRRATRPGSSNHVAEPDVLPAWLPILASAVSLAGIGVATYLTLAHYLSSVHLACSDTGAIDCVKVTESPQSVILGVPVALIGLVFFAAMLVLNLPASWRADSKWLRLVRVALAGSGVCFALYLVSAELLIINAICVWCTTAHILAFILFLLVAMGTSRIGLGLAPRYEDY